MSQDDEIDSFARTLPSVKLELSLTTELQQRPLTVQKWGQKNWLGHQHSLVDLLYRIGG